MIKKLFSFLAVVIIGCSNDDSVKDSPINQPVPEGAILATIVVDQGFSLTETKAYSLTGISPMTDEINKISIPNSFESAVFFLEEGTDKVLAVVKTSPSSNIVIVNAITVSQALMNLVPSYHSLPLTLKTKFERDAPAVKIYQDFVLTVDKLLQNGETVYSSDPKFIDQLVDLNNYINTVYLNISEIDDASSHVTSSYSLIMKQEEGDMKFSNWMSRANGGTVTNNVFSNALVQFSPHSGGETKSNLLKPNPLLNAEKTKFTLQSLSLKDDCYTVTITQEHNDAKGQNVLGAAVTFTDLFFSIVLNSTGESLNCTGAISKSLVPGISTTAAEAANLSTSDMVEKVGSIAWTGIKTAVTNKTCYDFLNPDKIAAALGQHALVAMKVLKTITIANKTLQLTSYLLAVVNPIELEEIIQLYDNNLKEACILVVDDKALKEEYAPGEVVYPTLKLISQAPPYTDWIKSAFEVNWIVEAGNGSVNLPESSTNNEGKATVAWKLPDDKSGKVTLIAELRDKEGDHLNGSPIEFTTNLNDSIAFYKRIIPGKWITKAYYILRDQNGNVLSTDYQQELTFLLLEDGTGKKLSSRYMTSEGCCQETDFTTYDDPAHHLVWNVTRSQDGRYIFSYYDLRWRVASTGRLKPSLDFMGELGSSYILHHMKIN